MLEFPEVHLRRAMRDRATVRSVGAEFLGVFLFQILGALIVPQPLQTAALFAALVYAMRFQSGGHLNPAISLAAATSGHIDWTRGCLYIIAQLSGALLGAFTGSALGEAPHSGCVLPATGVARGKLFMWEGLLTFFFMIVVYSAHFTPPGHGDAGPIAIGLALFAALSTGGAVTGYSPLNPASAIASTLTFDCGWSSLWVYLLAELGGVLLAAGWALGAYGRGPHYGVVL